jgi:RNA methyltransferase, TrmH family
MKLDEIKKLHQKKYRQQFGHYLVEGEHLVLELQKAAERDARLRSAKVYVTAEREHWRTPFELHVISNRHMDALTETEHPQGIVALVPLLPPPAARPDEQSIYLYEVQDPGNLGTILRTLAWFGNFRCLLSPGSVDPYNSKVIRASMGAIFHVAVELDIAIDSLPKRFDRMACLDMQGEPVQSAGFRTFPCYLFGNEARGLPREHIDRLKAHPFAISGTGAIDSLNLASTVNVCAYELRR